MTSNEWKILKCLWDGEGRMHIQVIAQKAGISSDYTRLLCRSLERGEYLKFADVNVCCLLTKGRSRFSAPEERDLDSGGQDRDQIIETAEFDAIVNPEIIIETEDKSQDVDLDNDEEETMDSDEKSEDENKQDEDLDQVLAELDQFVREETVSESSVEPELAEEEGSEAGLPADEAGDEKLVEEIQNEILEEEAELDELKDATPQEKEKLVEAGYKSVEDLAKAPVSRLIQSIGVNLKKAANWINQARRKTGVIHDEKTESKK